MGYAQSGASSPVAERDLEALARQAEERAAQLQAVLAAISDIVLVYDAGGDLVFINEVAARLTGVAATSEAAARLGAEMRVMELYWPDGRPVSDEERPLPRALRGEVIVGHEFMYRLRPGAPLRWARASAAPVHGREGQITGAVVTGADITAQKEAQAERDRLFEQVEAARENLRTIFDRLPEGILVVDTAQRVVMSNSTTRRYVGYDVTGLTLAELRRVHEFVMPDGRPFPPGQAPIDRALRGEMVTGVEARIMRLNGHVVETLESIAPLYDAHGRLTGAVVALTDVTAKRQAQAERERLLAQAQSARQRLQTILNRLPDGVVVIDATLRVTLANEASRELLGRDITGLSLSEIDGELRMLRPTGELVPPEERPVQRMQRGEQARCMEVRIQRPDGSVVDLLVGMAPLLDHEPTTFIVTMTDITARREAETGRERLLVEIQRARADLYTVIDRLPDWVLVLDMDLRVRLGNAATRRDAGRDLVGLTAADLRRIYGLVQADGRPFAPGHSPGERALRGEVVTNVEERAHLPDGTTYYALESAAPLYDSEGQRYGVVVILSDITALKQAQAERERLLLEVQAARENLQAVLRSLPTGVLVTDTALRIVLANDVAEQYMGAGLVGQTVDEAVRGRLYETPDGRIIPPDEMPLQRALRSEVVSAMELRVHLPDGGLVDTLSNAVALRDAEGRITGAVLVVTDITPQMQAQAERERLLADVQAARESLHTIVNRLPDGVLVIDPTLRITLCNRAVQSRIGRDVTGESVVCLWRELHFAAANRRPFAPGQTPVERALRGETVVGVEVSFELPGGQHIDALDSAATIYNPDGTVREVAMVFTDITPLKELDRAKDQFISVAAHELRTPLTALKGHAQILLRRAERAHWAEEDRRSLHTVDDQVDRLNGLIGRLLNVSRIRLGR
ncbi:MAG TPA: PAS domain-containing protein, partial [Anaerolineae bacterium]|nr:PAS domain-containing protein [Anaerolineae bacterium]